MTTHTAFEKCLSAKSRWNLQSHVEFVNKMAEWYEFGVFSFFEFTDELKQCKPSNFTNFRLFLAKLICKAISLVILLLIQMQVFRLFEITEPVKMSSTPKRPKRKLDDREHDLSSRLRMSTSNQSLITLWQGSYQNEDRLEFIA